MTTDKREEGGKTMKLHLRKVTWHHLAKRTKETAENVTEAAKAGASLVEKKAEDTLAQANLRRTMKELEDEIQQQMAAVGRLVYATHRGDPSDSDELEKLLEGIDSLQSILDGHRQELDQASGALLCPVCGAENEDNNVYCHNCGQPLRKT
jgi:rubrerythrin